jgi:dTDP-4-dehydrorhamnose 3,5-epimerase
LIFTPSKIPDVIVIEPKVYGDKRGFFMETWKKNEFENSNIPFDFVQDSHSSSIQGTLRGLHYQIKQSQGKLVRVTQGSIFDVAVDIRKSSPSYGKWVGETLTSENKKMLWIPPGFAHGFYVLSKTSELIYKFTNYYAPEHERTIRWNDDDINIKWPLLDNTQPLLSTKDKAGLSLKQAETHE